MKTVKPDKALEAQSSTSRKPARSAKKTPDLDAEDLTNADFRRADLQGVSLVGRDLTGADFTGANLDGARFTGATLVGCQFRGTSMTGTNFVGTDMTGSDFTECSAQRAVFGQANLTDAIFFGADLTEANLSSAIAKAADFRASKLDGARMLTMTLDESDLSRAVMSNTDLTGSSVDGSIFRGADMTRACLRGLKNFNSTDWIDVVVRDIEFSGAYQVRRAIADQNYLHEFRTQDARHEKLYQVWRITSDCGRSFVRWGITTAVVAILFSILYTMVAVDYGDYRTALSPFYFSIVTITTLGYGDSLPMSTAAQVVVLIEVIVGYVMLGGVLSIFATRMGRRAD